MNDMVSEQEMLPRLFTVGEYHKLAQIGLFERERVELLDGVVVTMPPIGSVHWSRHRTIFVYLHEAFGASAQVNGQISLPLGDTSEPEPDLAVLANLEYDKLDRSPEPREIYALVELSQSSLARDLQAKRRLYARFGVRDYLVVDLLRDVLHHFTKPLDADYNLSRIMRRDETFSIDAVPNIVLQSNPFLRS